MPIYKMSGKKEGLQKYRVRINYIDREGKNKQIDRVAYGLENAKDLERQLNHDIKEETGSRLTLQQLYEEYIGVKKYEVRETSLDKTMRILEYYVLPSLHSYRIDKLALPILQKWKKEIEERTIVNGSKGLCLTTKQNIFGEFRALLNYGVKMEYLSRNPLITVGNFKDAYITKHEMDYYMPEEFIEFITAAYKCAIDIENTTNSISEWNYYVFFNIAFYSGLRKGEIYALKWSDIVNNELSVTRSIAQKLKGADRETPSKNQSSIRTLQLPNPLIQVLHEHKMRYQQISGFSEDWRICGGARCVRDTTVTKRNEHYAQLAGIKTIRIHDFRHSHASLLANNGINIQEIARRLGHSKIEITWNIYSHLYPREEEKAVEILNKIRVKNV